MFYYFQKPSRLESNQYFKFRGALGQAEAGLREKNIVTETDLP